MKYIYLSLLLLFFGNLFAQKDSTKFIRHTKTLSGDTTLSTRQDAIYQRPALLLGKSQTAIGGYVEGNATYQLTDKAAEWNMEFRRFNIFLYSAIARKVKFLSELEFEKGTQEISIETGLLDLELNPALNVRGGILLAPIGAYNQRHDAPLWEFVERPLVSTQIIPTTLSEVGAGIHGKLYGHNKVFAYDAYVVNGLQDGIIINNEGRTFLDAGKTATRFSADNNNSPSFTGKISFRHRKIAEIGLSYYGGYYNTFRREGLMVDKKRMLSIFAVDFNTTILKKLAVSGEFAVNRIDAPSQVGDFFGKKQQGGYVEAVYPVFQGKLWGFEKATVNVGLRAEAIDYNVGKFSDTNEKIYDEIKALSAALSFRPAQSTVLKLNYQWFWTRDIMGNPTAKTGVLNMGLATYF